MADLALRLAVWAAGFLRAHPQVLLAVLAAGLFGSTITGRKVTPAGLRSRFGWPANILIFLLALVGGTTWLYKNRRDAGRAMLAVTCGAAVLVWGWSIQHSPQGWRPVIVLGSCAALVWLALGPLAREIGDRPLSVWFADEILRRKVGHAASTVLEGTTVRRTEARPDGTLVAHVQLPAGGRVDQLHPESVASSMAHEGLPIEVANVAVTAGAKAGQATMVVSPRPVASEWQILAEVDNRWPGPNGDNPFLPVPLGPCYRADGTIGVVEIPSDEEQAPHVLLGGATGSGKSVVLAVFIATLAYRRHTQLVLIDPARVEFRPWAPRALHIARGHLESFRMLRRAYDLMGERAAILDERGKRNWRIGVDGPRVEVIVDELAALTYAKYMTELPVDDRGVEMRPSQVEGSNRGMIQQISSIGRKYGIRLTVATQRPSTEVIPGDSRDNFGIRAGMAHETMTGARMTLADDAPDATSIPLSLKGGMYVRVDRGLYVPSRGFYPEPKQHVEYRHERLTVAAEEIAAETCHLRDERLTYPIGD